MNNSFWWTTLTQEQRQPIGKEMPGDQQVDVAIVGGGYTGLWTAYYLKQADPSLRIAIIEANEIGFGASGRNGGWASALFPASLRQLAKKSDRNGAIRMKRAMFETVTEIGRVVNKEGWDVDWHPGGTVGVARSTLQLARAQASIEDSRAWGFGPEDYDFKDAADTNEIVRMTETFGSVVTPHCAAINPAKLVRSLGKKVSDLGVDIWENTSARSINRGTVITQRGTVSADLVVRATEGYTPSLEGMKRDLLPVYSLMTATEVLPDHVIDQIGLLEVPTFHDGRHLIIYGQRTADNRIAFGGRGAPYHFGSTINPSFENEPEVFAALQRMLVELFPVLRDATFTHTWGGPLGIARDWWASCGIQESEKFAWAGGYVGDGVGTSNLSGRTLTDLILTRPSDLTNLPWVNHNSRKWEIEPLRWLGTNVGVKVMDSADVKEKRRGKESLSAKVFGRQIGH